MVNSYHNTTNSSGQTLLIFEEKAQTQEEIILQFFKAYKSDYTPDEVMRFLNFENTPITSIRRAITNLTKKGELIKTSIQRMGSYGKPTYSWRAKQNI